MTNPITSTTPDGMRKCGVCGNRFPATREYFTSNSKGKGGLQSFCKSCGAAAQKLYRKNSRDKVQATEQKRDREQRRANARERYAKNPEKHRIERKNYVARHPEIVKATNARMRAIRRSVEGTYTPDELITQYKSQKGKCWWCGCKLNGQYEPDHRIPLSRGGTNYINNIAVSCKKCNRSKYKSFPHERFGRLL